MNDTVNKNEVIGHVERSLGFWPLFNCLCCCALVNCLLLTRNACWWQWFYFKQTGLCVLCRGHRHQQAVMHCVVTFIFLMRRVFVYLRWDGPNCPLTVQCEGSCCRCHQQMEQQQKWQNKKQPARSCVTVAMHSNCRSDWRLFLWKVNESWPQPSKSGHKILTT